MKTRKRNAQLTTVLLVVAYAVCLPHASAAAKTKQGKPLTIDDALKTHSFSGFGRSSIAFSSDGKWLAYVARDNKTNRSEERNGTFRSGVPLGTTGDDVYLLNLATGDIRDLTGGKSENWLPTWSPDGHHLAFLSDRDGSGQAKLWVWNAISNELTKVCDIAVRTDEIEWMPGGKGLLFTALPEGFSVNDYVRKLTSNVGGDQLVTSRPSGSTAVVYESNATQQGGNGPQSDPWNLNYALRDLVLVDLASGTSKVIVHGQRIATFQISPDGSRVVYTIPTRFERAGSQQILFEIVTLSIKENRQRVMASDVRLDYDGAEFSWAPSSAMISYHTGGMEEKFKDCYIVTVAEGSPRNVSKFSQVTRATHRKSSTPLWDEKGGLYFIEDGALWRASLEGAESVKVAEIPNRQIVALISRSHNLLWTVDNGRATVVVTHNDLGKEDGFYKLDLENGSIGKLLEHGQCYTCVNVEPQYAVAADGRRLGYFSEDAQHPPDLWLSDSHFASPRRLTDLNPRFDDYSMGAARLVSWLSDDGERLQGALLLPVGYQEGKRYPLVVFVYGGVSLSNNFDHFGLMWIGTFNLQLLATRGYAVLLPDAPQHVGTPMFDLAKTVLPGVSEVIELGIADPDRLGVMGQSYGGYSTLSLIVQTKRFKAAMVADGYADNLASYGTMNKDGTAYQTAIEEQGQGLMGGTPWQFRDRYIENSPVYYFDRLETPVLILHGANDTTVIPILGDEVFVALRRLGKTVEYVKYEGEDHSPLYWSYANQVDFCNRMVAWFGRYLRTDSAAARP
jgi:dipeptidyl aminopeptidase/acylaminoacyl peptidase